jgi:hypothetical protein
MLVEEELWRAATSADGQDFFEHFDERLSKKP